MLLKIIGRKVYGLEVLGYQRILDLKDAQTLEGGRSQRKQWINQGGRWRCAS